MKRALTILLFLAGLGCSVSFAQVDCVFATLHVARVYGQVVDPVGEPISGAVVSISQHEKVLFETKTDHEGKFSFKGLSGQYDFRVKVAGYSNAWAPIAVEYDVVQSIRKNNIKVVLVIPGAKSCSRATTSNREYREMIQTNKKEFQNYEKQYAAQK